MGLRGRSGIYHDFQLPIRLSLNDFRETDANGAVSNIVANGGILASDTTPILRNTSGVVAQEISWAASNSDPICAQFALPPDFDGSEDVVVEALVNSGTTDPASFTVKTSWDGGSNVSTTLTDGAKSATYHKISAIIDQSNIPDTCSSVSVHLTPAAHTTNAIQIQWVRLLFLPKKMSRP